MTDLVAISQLVDLEINSALATINQTASVNGPVYVDDIEDTYTWTVGWSDTLDRSINIVLTTASPMDGFLLSFSTSVTDGTAFETKPVCNSSPLTEADLPVLMRSTLQVGFFLAEMLTI